MLHKYLIPVLFLVACTGISVYAQQAYTVKTLPNPKQLDGGYVSNPDGILSEAEVMQLNGVAARLEEESTAQIAIVIVQSIGEENPKDFATELFSYWGIGQADVDNGLLIFSVLDQRRTEFETGYGMEGILPDVACYRIGMQELVPYFREGQYGQGLINTLIRIKTTLESPEALAEIRSETGLSNSKPVFHPFPGLPAALGWYIWVNAFFHLLLLFWLVYTTFSKQDLYDRYRAVRWVYSFAFIILFPVPYLLVYFYLKYRLNYLRNHPRYGKESGLPMHKLSEAEDDAFLEYGQITEEEIGSVDYDVWVTDDQKEVLILRYTTRFTKYSNCPKCNYRTYYHSHSKVIQAATYSHSGLSEQTFLCKNCHYNQVKRVVIPKKTRSSSGGSFGSSGGGSSWGGGRSGGGGAGVSW
ncbi:MAG TPA: TPM domain-containing protein [Saprospiraceae bacterium]|nr:TPM domain-containing protein [Saprospiraceae bacterium]HMQ84506.1 TPM domain-containing protein [Saprospiraceae bacterium]